MFLGILLFVMMVALTRVYLDRQATTIGIQWEEKRHQMHRLQREIDNLRMDRERYMRGDYILIRARNIGLRPTHPSQVRTIGSDIESTTLASHQP